jgi:hypothetical protein
MANLADLAQALAPFASTRGQISVEWVLRAMGGPESGWRR